jgi:hypothetical protein
VRASVSKEMDGSFRGKKSHPTQNVMEVVDFDLRFTFVLARWEGTGHDALILRDDFPQGIIEHVTLISCNQGI